MLLELGRGRVTGADVSLPSRCEGKCQLCLGVQGTAEGCQVISEALVGWVLVEPPLYLKAVSKRGRYAAALQTPTIHPEFDPA